MVCSRAQGYCLVRFRADAAVENALGFLWQIADGLKEKVEISETEGVSGGGLSVSEGVLHPYRP